MSTDAVVLGDKVHIITRRLFPEDLRRHFVGEVVGRTDDLFRLQGYAFVFNPGTGEYRRRQDLRNRIVSFSDAGHIVTKLPRDMNVDALEYKAVDGRLVVTDSRGFSLDINEFGPSR
jgi:hypothetical protein